MKSLLLVLLLSGCSTFKMIWPIDHDPAGAQALITVKQTLSKVDCDDKDIILWNELKHQSEYLAMYSRFRDDPQAKNTEQLNEAINKAYSGSKPYCEATLKLNKTRLEVIEKAWRGR